MKKTRTCDSPNWYSHGVSFLINLVVALLFLPMSLADPGDLDPTFGAGGVFTRTISHNSRASAVVIQPDGKIVSAGLFDNIESFDFLIVRLNKDGTLDEDFGTGGVVLTDFPGQGSFDDAQALALQPNGKIIAVGFHGGAPRNFGVVRYHPDGGLDTSFGNDGRVSTIFRDERFLDQAFSVALQRDGKIVVGGTSHNRFHIADFALARYLPNGALDPFFGSGGKVLTTFTVDSSDHGFALAIRPDQKIILAGGGR